MTEHHGIAVADPVVEADLTVRGVGREVGRRIVDVKGHGFTPFREGARERPRADGRSYSYPPI